MTPVAGPKGRKVCVCSFTIPPTENHDTNARKPEMITRIIQKQFFCVIDVLAIGR